MKKKEQNEKTKERSLTKSLGERLKRLTEEHGKMRKPIKIKKK